MNKKEQAEMKALRDELAIAYALRWTEPVAPDVPVPSMLAERSGFAFNAHTLTARPAWSNSVSHGIGCSSSAEYRKALGSASQRGIALFSTRLLALKAMRHVVERRAAEELARIDDEIAKEREA